MCLKTTSWFREHFVRRSYAVLEPQATTHMYTVMILFNNAHRTRSWFCSSFGTILCLVFSRGLFLYLVVRLKKREGRVKQYRDLWSLFEFTLVSYSTISDSFCVCSVAAVLSWSCLSIVNNVPSGQTIQEALQQCEDYIVCASCCFEKKIKLDIYGRMQLMHSHFIMSSRPVFEFLKTMGL